MSQITAPQLVPVGTDVPAGTANGHDYGPLRKVSTTQRPMVQVVDVYKSFGATEVLRGVNLEVSQGEVVCIVGPSGAGKSTLLRTINHLEAPSRGIVYVAGELVGYERRGDRLRERSAADIARARSQTGMVFQHFNLFGNKTALGNVTLGLTEVRKVDRATAEEKARGLLEMVGLSHRVDAYPSKLSGGEQQRVAIARAFAMDPKVLLFDEPTSALDPERVSEVLDVMVELARGGMTMIVVTHELGFGRDVAETIVFMDGGQIIESGPCAQLLTSPREERTQAFLGSVR